MRAIRIPRVWLQLGDKTAQGHPLCFCLTGDNSRWQVIGFITDDGYEAACAAAEAYNAQRNKSRKDRTA